MKKTLLSMAVLGLLSFNNTAFGQYFISTAGQNPKGLNTESENPASLLTGWSKLWDGDANAVAAYSTVQNLPFAFSFNGNAVTQFKASSSGSVTFDVSSEALPAYGSVSLPSASIPANSINILGVRPMSVNSNGTIYKSTIISKTFGAAPNRQFWIQYNFFKEANIGSGWTYWAIVLEETSNKVYIVDMKTLSLTSSGSIGNTNVKMSAGIQVDSTTAYAVSGSPSLGANNFQTNNFDQVDNKYYEFFDGTQAERDMSVKVISTKVLIHNKPVNITGNIKNLGSKPVTSFKINYQVDGGDVVTGTISSVNIANNGGMYSFTHPTEYTATALGARSIKVWATEINGNNDENTSDDEMTKVINVMTGTVTKNALHEVFTSSTCPPCKPGNEVLQRVFQQKHNYTTIKYQYNFPGTGDPYYTTEARDRGMYYGGISSVPHLAVNGQFHINPNSYTTAMYDALADDAYVDITATQNINVADKKITITAKVKPLGLITGNYKVHVAILERETTKNIKSNGEREFYWVMKKMLPNAAGASISLANGEEQTITQTYTLPGNYRLPGSAQDPINLSAENSVEEIEDLMAVVFIQNESDKSILQSAWSTPWWSASAGKIGMEDLKLSVYPNPASQSFTIKSDAGVENTTVKVFGVDGRLVFEQQISEMEAVVSCEQLTNGIYYVEISNAKGKGTQKLVIAK
jgi:hypothetical protein